jgi:hypothetical protein
MKKMNRDDKRNKGICHDLPHSASNICNTKKQYILLEGSLEVKLPTIWTVEKER